MSIRVYVENAHYERRLYDEPDNLADAMQSISSAKAEGWQKVIMEVSVERMVEPHYYQSALYHDPISSVN